jgi:diguanylate cyclase (GGDEF)-like protein
VAGKFESTITRSCTDELKKEHTPYMLNVAAMIEFVLTCYYPIPGRLIGPHRICPHVGIEAFQAAFLCFMSIQERETQQHTTILVADDEPDNLALLQILLEREGYSVVAVKNGREAVEHMISRRPDLAILDVMMPVMDGLEACRRIKLDEGTRDIPVIFLSAHDETDIQVNGLSLGANDFVGKPFSGEVLLARVDVAIRLKRDRDRLLADAEVARMRLELAQEQALTDALTGLLNRFGLQRSLGREQAEARRYQRPLSCLMIDMDYFKSVNDKHGHSVGDSALQQVARILTDGVRGSDMVFRYGGEEFLALLPETDLEGATALAEMIREVASSYSFGYGENNFSLTLSIGAAALCDGESGNDMVARADLALYQAKKHGRNRVEFAECD